MQKQRKRTLDFYILPKNADFFVKHRLLGWLQAAAFVEQFMTKSKIHNQICSSSER